MKSIGIRRWSFDLRGYIKNFWIKRMSDEFLTIFNFVSCKHEFDVTKFCFHRFSAENKSLINQYTYLPFGAGPRNCIGMRLALLETKLVLIRLVQHFKFLPCEKTEATIAWN